MGRVVEKEEQSWVVPTINRFQIARMCQRFCYSDPAAVLIGLNRRLVGRIQGGFATTIVLKLGTSGDCSIANAGHLPPFLNSSEIYPWLPLGIVTDADYVSRCIVLSDDDHMTLYTDGALEACNSARELYGFERIKILLTNVPMPEPSPRLPERSDRRTTSLC